MARIALFALVPLALVGCSGAETEAAPVAVPAITKHVAASSTPATAAQCETVAQAVADNLAQAAEASKAGKVGAVKGPVSETWLVAVELVDGPAAGEVAVFETASIVEVAQTRAVNGMAQEFTDLPESAYTVADDATDEAIACM